MSLITLFKIEQSRGSKNFNLVNPSYFIFCQVTVVVRPGFISNLRYHFLILFNIRIVTLFRYVLLLCELLDLLFVLLRNKGNSVVFVEVVKMVNSIWLCNIDVIV